jgi:hypothetical protein
VPQFPEPAKIWGHAHGEKPKEHRQYGALPSDVLIAVINVLFREDSFDEVSVCSYRKLEVQEYKTWPLLAKIHEFLEQGIRTRTRCVINTLKPLAI